MEAKKPRKRNKARRTYTHKPNAVCITIHSMDGAPVPKAVLNACAASVEQIATDYGLLINLAEA